MAHLIVKQNRVESLFCEISQKILDVLENSFDTIGAERKRYISTLLKETTVHSGEDDSDIISSYIIAEPEIYSNATCFQKISLYMPKPNDTNVYLSNLYHEIAHIIANAPIISLPKKQYLYNWGVCSTIYTVVGDCVNAENYYERMRLNEFLNDLCAEYFFDIIQRKKYHSISFKNPLLRVCKCKKAEMLYDVIVAYIMNDYLTIEQLLCKYSGKSIVELRKFISTI